MKVPFLLRLLCRQLFPLIGILLSIVLTGCQKAPPDDGREIVVEQSWELDLGDAVEGFPVVGSLGDVSVYLKNSIVRAPFDGEVERSAIADNCIFFSSPEVPAYLFRYCGLKGINLGEVRQGKKMGKADYLHFATMRRQPEGTWAIVEPSRNVLERSLEKY